MISKIINQIKFLTENCPNTYNVFIPFIFPVFDSDVAPASQPHCCQEVLKEVVELKFLINNLINLVTPLVQEGSVENSNTTNDMSDRFPLPNLASLLELNETMQAPDVYNSVVSLFL